jgi:hypothetical protein
MDLAEERLHSGDVTLALVKQQLDQIDGRLEEMAKTLQELRLKPARRWDTVVSQLIDWALVALLGIAALRLGLA